MAQFGDYPMGTLCQNCRRHYGAHYGDRCVALGNSTKFKPVETPQFEHDCRLCVFMGRYQHPTDFVWYDLYKHKNVSPSVGHTILARFSNQGWDYLSMGVSIFESRIDSYGRHNALYVAWQRFKAECDPQTRSADRGDVPQDHSEPGAQLATGGSTHMEYATKQWLEYTDGILAAEGPAAKEIKLIMGVTRGPDYVRLRGGEVSPKLEDRKAVKLVTTAVLRAKFFPRAAKAASKGAQLVADLVAKYGVSQKKAEAMAEIADVKAGSNWLVNVTGTFADSRVLNEQLGSQSHFAIKVKQAAALLGIYRD